MRYIRSALTKAGVCASHPAAFAVVFGYVVVWLAWNPESFGWAGVATIATWLMTLIIQRAEHRDTQAIHAKLDELLRATANARDELTHLDEEEPEVIVEHRTTEREQIR